MRPTVPDYVKEYVDRADLLEKRNQYDEAIRVLREAIEHHYEIAVLHNNLGCCLANLEEYREAELAFQEAVRLTGINRASGLVVPSTYPDEPQRNFQLARARRRELEHLEVETCLQRASLLERKHQYGDAIRVLREGIAQHPDVAVLHNNLGCYLVNSGNPDARPEAEKVFLEAVRLTPTNRHEGIIVPNTYPAEPERNLRTIQRQSAVALRSVQLRATTPGSYLFPGVRAFLNRVLFDYPPAGRRADGSVEEQSIVPGISFPTYIFWFLARNPVGWALTIAAVVVTSLFWSSHSPNYSLVFSGSCLLILIAAYAAYRADPRLK